MRTPAKRPATALKGSRVNNVPDKILASGKFDLLHPGHIYYLESSAQLSNDPELFVVIAHQENIKDNLFSNRDRKKMLEALGFVDRVILGRKERDFRGVLETVRPDIIALGHDQTEETVRKHLEELSIEAEIKRIEPYKPEKYSSTAIKQKMGFEKTSDL